MASRHYQLIGSGHRMRRMAKRIVSSLLGKETGGLLWVLRGLVCVGECGEDHCLGLDPSEKPGGKSWMTREKLRMVFANGFMIRIAVWRGFWVVLCVCELVMVA